MHVIRLRHGALAAGVAVLAALAVSLPAAGAAGAPGGSAGVSGPPHGRSASIAVTPDGRYTIEFASPHYRFGGTVGHPVSAVRQRSGSDRTGGYTEIDFSYQDGTARQASIRAYRGTPVVLFSLSYPDGGADTAPFPDLSVHPQLPYQQTYQGCFAASQFNTAAGAADSPWLFFDHDANAYLLSPASNFPSARTWRDGDALASGIDPAVGALPAGTTQQTLLVASAGINSTYQAWGNALTNLEGKKRPANDADVTLDKLGYWTDNGATYYYNYDHSLGYAGTLQAVKDDWDARGIPMGYLQLDSWFYPKGPDAVWDDNPDGEYEYTAASDLFPGGLDAFRTSVGVPLVTHARWIDPASPYHGQYAMSGNVVTDPAYWDDRAGYLAGSGVTTYEQDWLCSQAQPSYNFADRETFEDTMAGAMSRDGITMQYCMPLPRDMLQESRYSNLTTTRVSNDRFERSKWDAELYTSRFAASVGAWPWTDVLMSTETRNLLLSNLTAGPVGVGDAIGAESKANLMQVARPDGVIVKPDVPLTPTDATYVGDAAGEQPAMVAATHTDHGTLRDAYVYAYARSIPLPDPDAVYQAEDATLSGPVVATDHNGYTGTGFADYQHDNGDSVTWTVQAPADGTYTLLFRYANGGTGNRPLGVTVDGTSAGTQPFAPTGGWDSWRDQTAVVTLHAGANTIAAASTGANGANVDYLGVSAGVVTPPTTQDAAFRPASLGVAGDAYVYDYFSGTGAVVPAGQTYHAQVGTDGSYFVVAPLDRAGVAFLGDAGKFVSLGAKRIPQLADDGATVHARVAFADGETQVTMHGYAPGPVTVRAQNGRAGDVRYDAATHLFSFEVTRGRGAAASFVVRRG